MRLLVLILLVPLAATTLVACGSADREPRERAGNATTRTTPAERSRPPGRLDNAAQCRGSRTSTGPLRATSDLAAARSVALAAARRATRSGHRFAVELDVTAGRLRADATVFGRRTPNNASSALVVWSGAAGTLLPDLGLRIVDDRLYLQRGSFDSPWRRAGSASGVSLDVGRELLDHPFLLRTTSARGNPAAMTVTFSAPASRLRTYATRERRGPVTDLLRNARQLTLVAQVRGGRLVGDRFTLVTSAPASPRLGPIAPGTLLRIEGVSSYCRLRAVDRTEITAPRVID